MIGMMVVGVGSWAFGDDGGRRMKETAEDRAKKLEDENRELDRKLEAEGVERPE
jgi:hypothetical protein